MRDGRIETDRLREISELGAVSELNEFVGSESRASLEFVRSDQASLSETIVPSGFGRAGCTLDIPLQVG